MPFRILGVDSDNGSELINDHLFQWCQGRQVTFTRARPGNKNDGCHVEQKNWAVVRTIVGYHRYDTAAELLLLNETWQLQSKLTNYFSPAAKTDIQDQQRRQSIQETRQSRHPVSPRDRSPHHERRAHRGTDPDLLPDQSRRHPTPGPSPDRPAPPHLPPPRPAPPPKPKSTSAHDYVRQRIHLRAHLDVRQQADIDSVISQDIGDSSVSGHR